MKKYTLQVFLLLLMPFISIAQTGHQMDAAEKALIPSYMLSRSAPVGTLPNTFSVTPPASPVRTIAEWEELQALMVGWKSYPSILREIVRAAKQETRVIIVFTSPDTQTSLINYLAAGGVDTVNVTFLNSPLNSVWSRDYGPWSAYTNDVDSLITIDWIYNRPRPQDDAVPVAISNYLGTPLYQTTTAPFDLVHTGGNFMTDGFGTGFSSELILEENSPIGGFGINHTASEIDSIMLQFMGINRYIKMTKLPYDVIHHIDMHMKLLDEQTLLVGQYPNGVADGPQIEANLLYVVNNFNSVYGTPYKVVRIPMPDDNNLYPNNGGDYFTYTNSSIINKAIIVPVYGIPEDTVALNIYRNQLPGYTITPINCAGMIGALGALHCITKELGTNDPLLISHQPLENTTDTINDYPVGVRIQHRSGINSAILYWTTDTATTWQNVSLTPSGAGNIFTASIPAQSAGTTVYYYIGASSVSGKSQVRPMPAPSGWWKFDVTGTTAINDIAASVQMGDVFPNPCRGITCIPFEMIQSSLVNVKLLDVTGRIVADLGQHKVAAGKSNVFFNAADLPDGIFMLQVQMNNHELYQKVIIQK
jgi:agmatine deiminase